MPEPILLAILVIHFLADFALQTHDQAINKSTSLKWLFYHVGMYSLIWLLAAMIFMPLLKALIFAVITFAAHYVTDYITSRIGKPFWKNNDYHNGFVVVGFDQVLHYIQLFLTFKLLL